jgi:predicted restriction endonuclease
MPRITEKELKLPALHIIDENPGITTSELIIRLEELIRPEGEDLEILQGRNDTKFSQKVRNLKSHNTLEEYATYDEGIWHITPAGKRYLDMNKDVIRPLIAMLANPFTRDDKAELMHVAEESTTYGARELYLYDERDLIDEGGYVERNSLVRKRSNKLRDAALKHYKDKDGIKCALCGFDFEKTYGEIGKDFIEIHHKKPIYQYEDQDQKQFLRDALDNLIPVCSNCHRMLHRKKDISEEDIIEALKKTGH